MTGQATQQVGQRTFLGHPRGLLNLAGIEVWERFSFFGMQAILTYYLYFSITEGGLGLPKGSATSLVGAYGSLVYVTTMLGAWIADRLLGAERTVFYSGILILFGHLALAVFPGLTGVAVGLVCIAIGSGALKANTTSLLGALYEEGDERRDAGFSIFYMMFNFGAFIGPLLTALTRTSLGFHFGFGLAAIGMAVGLVQYAIGRRNFGGIGRSVPNPLPLAQAWKPALLAVLAVAVVIAAFAIGLVTIANLADVATYVIVLGAVVLFTVMLSSKRVSSVERSRVVAFIPMFLATFVFFSLFQQIFTVIAIYAEQRVDLSLGGFSIPPDWAQSVDPIGILIFAPILAAMWVKLGNRQPSTPIKFSLGLIGMGACFLLFLPMAGGSGRTTPAIIVGVILLLFAIPELLLSPIGLSLATKLAPKAFQTQMVALNFMAVAAGTATAGSLGGLYSPEYEFSYFGIVGGISVVLGLLLVVLSPVIRKLMRGVD